jgi:hypothetical protein
MTRQPQHPNRGPVFVVRLRPTRPGADGIRAQHAILKALLRHHGFHCLTACEERTSPAVTVRRRRSFGATAPSRG